VLDPHEWRNDMNQVGHGYWLDLEFMGSRFIGLDEIRPYYPAAPRQYYKSPALIGCAFAVTRQLYEKLLGFDPDMRLWGVEDIDFGLRAWFMGHPVLLDPKTVIGHRFQTSFDNYPVSWSNDCLGGRM
jgi:GT2 family glycosyltransferase